jgi:HEPN domain-containing protein
VFPTRHRFYKNHDRLLSDKNYIFVVMADKKLNIKKITEYWKESSQQDYKTMLNLFMTGDYNWALFLGHLVIEKLIKAIYVKNNGTHAIMGHDLLRLSKNAGLNLSEEQEDLMDQLTTFNINARYDNYKQEFYRLCTKDFAEIWKIKIEVLREWLLNQL